MLDMNGYLDSDALRRQANTIHRLTVVTIVGMIGTVATGYLGMNLVDAAAEPLLWRTGFLPVHPRLDLRPDRRDDRQVETPRRFSRRALGRACRLAGKVALSHSHAARALKIGPSHGAH
jgi:hypothetical protein